MGFYIPNAPDASVIDQSEPDSVDFAALGNRKSGVISGCEITAQVSPNQTVQVSAGEILTEGVYKTVSSSSNLSVGLGSSAGPRFDLVVATSTGALAVREGTAGANPTFPTLSSGDVLLAAVYRTSGTASTVSGTQITDKRIFMMSNDARTGAGEPSGSVGSIGDFYINTTVTTLSGRSQLWVKTGASTWENLAEYHLIVPRAHSASTDSPSVTDIDNTIEYSSACNISIPTASNANFPVGCIITLVKSGASGDAVVVQSGGANVTVHSSLGLKLRTQWSTASLTKRTDGSWLLFGDLTTA
jgi:hypothetical protein